MSIDTIITFMRDAMVVTAFAGIFVEFTPVKINPVSWLMRKILKPIYDKIDKISSDLQEHIADDMRTYIIDFQNQCIQKRKHTKEEWNRAYRMCEKYETYITDNHLKNSEAYEAIAYIRRVYRHCLEDGEFLLKEGA